MVWIEAGGVNKGGVRTGAYGTKTLTVEDMKAIEEHVGLVTNVSPQADTRVQLVYGSECGFAEGAGNGILLESGSGRMEAPLHVARRRRRFLDGRDGDPC